MATTYGLLNLAASITGIVIGLWTVGAAAQILLGSAGVRLRGVGVALALGSACSAVVGSLAFVWFARPAFAFLVLLGVSTAWLLGVIANAVVLRSPGARSALRTLAPTGFDVAAGVIGVVVLAPLLARGPVFWTNTANDFPSYAASVHLWTSGDNDGDAFAERHPDRFGQLQVGRALSEKPMATGVFVAMSRLSTLPPEQLLTPLVGIPLVFGMAGWMELIDRLFRRSYLETLCAVAAPTVSVVSFYRVLEAQPGHVLVVGLSGATMLVVGELLSAENRRALGAAAGASIVMMAAVLGSNITLVLGSGLMLGGAITVLALAAEAGWLCAARRLAAVAVGCIVLSAPLFEGYRTSLEGQTTGEAGADLPLGSPLALVGLQQNIRSVAGTSQALIAWIATLALAGLALFTVRARLPWRRPLHAGWVFAGLSVATAANAAIVMSAVGPTNYASHKFFALFVATVGPFLLAAVFTCIRQGSAATVRVGLVLLVLASGALAVRAAHDTPTRATEALFRAARDPRVAAVGSLGIELDNQFQNSVAALAVDNAEVVVTGENYGGASAPTGSTLLTTDRGRLTPYATEIVDLGNGYRLATLDLVIEPGRVYPISSTEPASQRFLFGRFHALEADGAWSAGEHFSMAFDLPPELRGQDVRVTLSGRRLASPDHPRDVIISAAGHEAIRETVTSSEGTEYSMVVSQEATASADGRVTLTVQTPGLLSPSAMGSPDGRLLGFKVFSFAVEAAS